MTQPFDKFALFPIITTVPGAIGILLGPTGFSLVSASELTEKNKETPS